MDFIPLDEQPMTDLPTNKPQTQRLTSQYPFTPLASPRRQRTVYEESPPRGFSDIGDPQSARSNKPDVEAQPASRKQAETTATNGFERRRAKHTDLESSFSLVTDLMKREIDLGKRCTSLKIQIVELYKELEVTTQKRRENHSKCTEAIAEATSSYAQSLDQQTELGELIKDPSYLSEDKQLPNCAKIRVVAIEDPSTISIKERPPKRPRESHETDNYCKHFNGPRYRKH